MDLLNDLEVLLTTHGYRIDRRPVDEKSLVFEDFSTIGFVREFSSASHITAEWEKAQNRFLESQARRLRYADEKSWNLYCVFLTQDTPVPADAIFLSQIEENFQATRKIARGNIVAPIDLEWAMLPLLPLRNVARVDQYDLINEFRQKLPMSVPTFEALLSGESTDDLARRFLEES